MFLNKNGVIVFKLIVKNEPILEKDLKTICLDFLSLEDIEDSIEDLLDKKIIKINNGSFVVTKKEDIDA